MKAISTRYKVLFALLVLVTISVFLFSMLLSRLAPPKEEMHGLVQQKEGVLLEAVKDAGGRYIDRQNADTANLQAAFAQTALTAIDARSTDGTVTFSFTWTNLGETTIELYYFPADFDAVPDSGEWKLTVSSDNAWRWDGGGMMGKGYIIVERLKEKWFYVEKYYPT